MAAAGGRSGLPTRAICRQGLLTLAAGVEKTSEVLSGNVLHGDEVIIVDLAQIVDVGDVLVIQLGGELGLVDEHVDEVLVLGGLGEDLLDGDTLLEALDPLSARLPDLGHTPQPDALLEGVLAKLDGWLGLFFRDRLSGFFGFFGGWFFFCLGFGDFGHLFLFRLLRLLVIFDLFASIELLGGRLVCIDIQWDDGPFSQSGLSDVEVAEGLGQ